nr:hypothetical protein [Salinivirgaceae bacterium]
MIKTLLKIRLKQIYREISGIGLIRLIVLAGIIGFVGLALYIPASDKSTSQYISIGFLLVVMLIHLKRRDKLFLKSHFSDHKILMLSEYIVLSVPFISC